MPEGGPTAIGIDRAFALESHAARQHVILALTKLANAERFNRHHAFIGGQVVHLHQVRHLPSGCRPPGRPHWRRHQAGQFSQVIVLHALDGIVKEVADVRGAEGVGHVKEERVVGVLARQLLTNKTIALSHTTAVGRLAVAIYRVGGVGANSSSTGMGLL